MLPTMKDLSYSESQIHHHHYSVRISLVMDKYRKNIVIGILWCASILIALSLSNGPNALMFGSNFRQRIRHSPIFFTLVDEARNSKDMQNKTLLSGCELDLSRMQNYNLSARFEYSKRLIRRIPLDEDRRRDFEEGMNPAEDMQGDLFPAPNLITWNSTSDTGTSLALESCSKDILSLMVRQDTTEEAEDLLEDAGHLIFGVASTSERLLEAKDHLGFWLGNTGARLLIACPQSPFVPLMKWELEQRGVLVTVIISPEKEYLDTYFRLVLWLNEARTEKTKWLTFIDDDTFYFSLKRFTTMLQKYDPETDVYIGAPSEDSWQMMRSGLIAFGGAGITLSAPLIEKVTRYYDVCKTYTRLEENDPEIGGDLRLARCITRNTRTKLSIEKDLHQVDLRGDVRGLIQGPRVPLNWHHYHSSMWGGLDILKFARSVPFCDSDCLFQRWKFRANDNGGDALISTLHLGHSFIRYRKGVDPELSWYEQTWIRKPLSIYDESLEPLRASYEENVDRFTYFYEGGEWSLKDGSFSQIYIRRGNPEVGEIDSVVELVWS